MNIRSLNRRYDLVIAGGGATGAGVFHMAAQYGFRPLLVEARDFAWGTSSRSSKMVHGGLRYLKQGRFSLTRAAVRERQALMADYPGLVTPLQFLMPLYGDHGPSRTSMEVGLTLYSLMAQKRQHCHVPIPRLLEIFPGLREEKLKLGLGFMDAQVDDARLVLRLIQDGRAMGGHALNYVRARAVERNLRGEVQGVELQDTETGATAFVETPVIINATGPFAEKLHPCGVKGCHIRPLRGSHLIFPREKLPLDRVLSFFHPRDNRAVFLFPWENTTVVGTTDVDHQWTGDGFKDPAIGTEEAAYIMEGMDFILPGHGLSPGDCRASMAGIRPILSRKKQTASKESREHGVWEEKGLVSITGGKLTTFRLLARDALKAAAFYLPTPRRSPRQRDAWLRQENHRRRAEARSFYEDPTAGLSGELALRLSGRFGPAAPEIFQAHDPRLWSPIADTCISWAELCHGAGQEDVRHLEDLMLRRVRLGLFLPRGGMDDMDRIRETIAPHLDWDAQRWEEEIQSYEKLWESAYAPPVHPKGGCHGA
ncbi:MAG: glycerol-3-phosphate dehydrogenase/oxidase [Desulfobacterales bacterium]|nr:glycerol-3-phosphate dehydrogenase/oxidase [Desulfobacterales bacterium]